MQQQRFQRLGALGAAYSTVRAAQFVGLVVVIGLCGHFIDEIIGSQREVPAVLVGTISVSSIAILYVMASYILYYDSLLPLLVGSGIDFLMLIATIVVAAVLGKPGPLSRLSCELLPAKSAFAAANSLTSSSSASAAALPKLDLLAYYAQDKPHCFEAKTIWGLSIALCVLFAFSSILSAGLWRRVKGPSSSGAAAGAAPRKDIEG